MRVLLVLALVLQSLASAGLTAEQATAPEDGGRCDCGTSCCCAAVDRCMCNADPGSRDRPAAPAPRDGKELTPLLALSVAAAVVDLPDPGRHARRPQTQPERGATHNEIQALLGVWRT